MNDANPAAGAARSPSPAAPPRGFAGYLLFTAGVSGAMVMVVEVLGSRVIGPFFGVSLFVWTALITVTLLALAIGYALGGQLADRRPAPAWLYALLIAAGLLVAAVPLLKTPVLEATWPLGLRTGALVGAAVLFGPALLLLGCVSPFVVRLAAREWGRLGRTIGVFTAVSTAGSFVGTVSTGFFLIGYVGVARAFVLAGALLVALGVGYFAVFQRRGAGAVAALAAIALLGALAWPTLAGRGVRAAATLADGTRAEVVHAEDSFYGHIRVVDYRYGAKHQRELIIDGLVQGGVDMADGRSVYEYPYLLRSLPLALHPQGRSALVIGVGAGIVPAWLEAQGIATDVIDIDPKVLAAARRFFGYVPRGRVDVDDARHVLARPGPRYDVVILDVFNGDTTPGHLLSVEALRLLEQRLAPGGVLAANLVVGLGDDDGMSAAVLATMRRVFEQVVLFPVFDPDRRGAGRAAADWGNVTVVAYQGPRRTLAGGPPQDVHPAAAPLLHRVWGRTLEPAAADGLVLTDDFNPLDVRDTRVKEAVRRRIVESTPVRILVGD